MMDDTLSNTGLKPFIVFNILSCNSWSIYVITGNISTLLLLLFGTFSHCTQKVVNKNKQIFISAQ